MKQEQDGAVAEAGWWGASFYFCVWYKKLTNAVPHLPSQHSGGEGMGAEAKQSTVPVQGRHIFFFSALICKVEAVINDR